MEAKLEAVVARLEAVAAKLEGSAAPSAAEETEDYPAVNDYDKLFTAKIAAMMTEAKTIDPEIVEMTEIVANSSSAVRRLVLIGQRSSKPDEDPYKYVNEASAAGIKWCNDHFKAKFVNHLKAVNEVMTLLTWPTIGASAEEFATQMTGSVECYTNKIIREFKGKDDKHTRWVQALVQACKALPDFINDHEKGGIKWNSRAPKATIEALSPSASKAAAAKPAAAPAPKPAAAPAPAAAAPAAAKPKIALNIPVKAAPAKTAAISRPQEHRVQVEYFDGKDPVLEGLGIEDIVNFFQCKNCQLIIPSKVKAISVLGCEKVNLTTHDVIGTLELTNLKKSKIFIEGTVNSATTDKCDGIEIYLNEASKKMQLVSSFSSAINIEMPDLKEEGNFIEFPVPEQIKVTFGDDRKLHHEVYVHE